MVRSSERAKVEAASLRCPGGASPRVLLAEDAHAARMLTAALLRRMGCEVDAVEHGEQALTRVQNYAYDVVVMDIEMPVMDGVVAAQEIRYLGGAAARTPIIALSAFLADASKSNAWKDVFDACIAKPADGQQLATTIKSVLSDAGEGARANTSAPQPAPDADTSTTAIDRQALDDMIAQIPAGERSGLIATAISEAMSASEAVIEAVRRNDRDQVARLTHQVRGIAVTFAMKPCAQAAEVLAAAASSNGDLAAAARTFAGRVEAGLHELAAIRASLNDAGKEKAAS